jgi:hypothetical protein
MWSAVRSGRFVSGKDPVPIVQERGWASGLLLDGTKNLAAPAISFVNASLLIPYHIQLIRHGTQHGIQNPQPAL